MPHKHWCRDCMKDYDCRGDGCGDMLYTETCPTCELCGQLEASSLPWWEWRTSLGRLDRRG